MDKQIIIIKPKSLSSKDKEKLTKAGNIVVETNNPNDVIFKTTFDATVWTYLNCANCGERMYMTTEREVSLRKSSESFYCTHGHSNVFNK